LAEFHGYRKSDFGNDRDAVMLAGPNGSLASGRFLRLAHGPPAPALSPTLQAGAAVGWIRLGRRIAGLALEGRVKREGRVNPQSR